MSEPGKEVEYYVEVDGKKRPAADKDGRLHVEFPRTVVGRESTLTYYVRNMLSEPITGMRPITSDPDLVVTSVPKSLQPGQMEKIEITFRPRPERRTTIKNGTFTFEIDIN